MKKSLRLVRPSVLRYPHPVIKSSALGKRSVRPFMLNGERYVLFRDRQGAAVAVRDVCPHRGAPLSRGKVNEAGQLVCGYHAWRIGGDGSAQSPAVPKKRCRVTRLETWERHGFVWVALEGVDEAAFPRFIEPGYSLISSFSMASHAPIRVLLDNFSEIEHAFRVHRFIGPSEEQLDSVKFRVEAAEEETRAYSSSAYRSLPLGFGRFFGIRRGDRYHNDWVFRFKPLFGCYRNYWTNDAENERRPVSFIVTTFLVPIDAERSDLHVFLQLAIASRVLRWLAPLIAVVASLIVRYEIWADARIARFAPDQDAGADTWQLTRFDKQIVLNRRLVDAVYFGSGSGPIAPEVNVAVPGKSSAVQSSHPMRASSADLGV